MYVYCPDLELSKMGQPEAALVLQIGKSQTQLTVLFPVLSLTTPNPEFAFFKMLQNVLAFSVIFPLSIMTTIFPLPIIPKYISGVIVSWVGHYSTMTTIFPLSIMTPKYVSGVIVSWVGYYLMPS